MSSRISDLHFKQCVDRLTTSPLRVNSAVGEYIRFETATLPPCLFTLPQFSKKSPTGPTFLPRLRLHRARHPGSKEPKTCFRVLVTRQEQLLRETPPPSLFLSQWSSQVYLFNNSHRRRILTTNSDTNQHVQRQSWS